jgi:regulator of protease activity HflC (stomatin/prohibitin superfamily)
MARFPLQRIGPAEMAVRIHWDKPIGFADSGWYLIWPLPGCYFKRYPKKIYNLEFPGIEVITKDGEFEEKFYRAQDIKVDAVVYLNFPREKGREETHPLIKILKNGIPIEEEKLKNWIKEAVEGALRHAFAQVVWYEAVKNIARVNEVAETQFIDKEGPLMKAGFRLPGIRLLITRIILPPKLEAMLAEPEKARLAAETAEREAEKTAIDISQTAVEIMAKARGKAVDEIRKEIDTNEQTREKYLTLAKDIWIRKMGIEGGAYLDIRVEGAEGIERMILNALALWKRMPSGKRGRREEAPPPISEEEHEEILEEALGE